jgi:hypothetical protein
MRCGALRVGSIQEKLYMGLAANLPRRVALEVARFEGLFAIGFQRSADGPRTEYG